MCGQTKRVRLQISPRRRIVVPVPVPVQPVLDLEPLAGKVGVIAQRPRDRLRRAERRPRRLPDAAGARRITAS